MGGGLPDNIQPSRPIVHQTVQDCVCCGQHMPNHNPSVGFAWQQDASVSCYHSAPNCGSVCHSLKHYHREKNCRTTCNRPTKSLQGYSRCGSRFFAPEVGCSWIVTDQTCGHAVVTTLACCVTGTVQFLPKFCTELLLITVRQGDASAELAQPAAPPCVCRTPQCAG